MKIRFYNIVMRKRVMTLLFRLYKDFVNTVLAIKNSLKLFFLKAFIVTILSMTIIEQPFI